MRPNLQETNHNRANSHNQGQQPAPNVLLVVYELQVYQAAQDTRLALHRTEDGQQ
jgi:hypothetical protein